MIEVVATTEIAAPAAVVWDVLVELDRFSAWNPFIRNARGELRVGGLVRVRVQTGLGIPMRFRATVLEVSAGRALHWRGHVGARFVACGEHWFELVPLGPARTRFAQRERFSGIVPWLGRPVLEREARRGFEVMNAALRVRAEDRHRAAGRAEAAP